MISGKFGCKPNERVPYLHYYYTNQWFTAYHMEGIGHIAANHSTWDLELDNISVESLVLIYADFRVKQMRGEDGRELTKIYTLKDSFDVILSKLDNVDEKKRNRYRVVYSRLYEFERYMRSKGVDVDLTGHPDPAEKPVDIVLQSGKQVVRSFCILGDRAQHRRHAPARHRAPVRKHSRGGAERERLEECPRIFKHVQ